MADKVVSSRGPRGSRCGPACAAQNTRFLLQRAARWNRTIWAMRLGPLAESDLKAFFELVWRNTSDAEAFATTGGAGSNRELRTWHVQNVGEESQKRGVGGAIHRWRDDANLESAIGQLCDRGFAGARNDDDRKQAPVWVYRHPRCAIGAGCHAATSAWRLARVRRSRATSERSAAGTTGRPSARSTSSTVMSSSKVPVRWLTMRSEM